MLKGGLKPPPFFVLFDVLINFSTSKPIPFSTPSSLINVLIMESLVVLTYLVRKSKWVTYGTNIHKVTHFYTYLGRIPNLFNNYRKSRP
jgi:hypothetical protein